ncbi:ABC transporter permease [Lacicoccus qingdaonensis]|uniref:ABC-2 type transport system permease protein n=1 Tax=Lacicoccus qingdaonensis TaxID=576118 RepID=A0A1G9GGB8_9BACL|nr:ABC transporter permease [Salinicoccus qingdaonensis]SDK99691.1 ABC-2 type transport system permease protein [Salinicoccus qingdaonensis]
MNITRVAAIFEKDFKEFMRNMMLFTSVLIPVVLAAFFGRMDGGEGGVPDEIVIIIVGVVFSAVTFSSMMTMMAEENEKDTLRGLLQSPASIIDIIAGKSAVITLMTIISLVASIMLVEADGFWSMENIAGLILLGIFFLNLGIGIGLLVKSVATTSVYLIPIMFLFGFTPYIEFLVTDEGHIARQIAECFPLYQNLYILNGDGGAAEYLILLAWVAVSFGIVIWAFNRRKSDD